MALGKESDHGCADGVVVGLAIPAAIVGGVLTRVFPPGPLKTPEEAVSYLAKVAGSKVPGLQYVVVTADDVGFDYAGGWADIARQRPMTPDTTMMAFSMTKTLTAVAILQLVEQARSADEELDRYVPGTPYAGNGITIRHLLAHTAGLRTRSRCAGTTCSRRSPPSTSAPPWTR